MKITQVLAGNEEGGLENHFIELCNGLAKRGLAVSAIAHSRYEQRMDSAVSYHAMDLSASRNNPSTLFALWKKLKDIDSDIVHSQANKATAMLSNIRPWVKAKRVATVHSQKKSSRMFRHVDLLIGVSAGVLDATRNSGKSVAQKVIYNGLDSFKGEYKSRAECIDLLGLPHDVQKHRLSLSAGRLVPVKGYDRLIDSWDKSFGYLVICGEGSDRKLLEEKIHQRGLADRISLPGHVENIRSLLKAFDLMLLSSEREGFSYAMAEALFAELPVLSTRVAGPEEILPEAMLVANNDPSVLQPAIAHCLDHLDEAKQSLESTFAWAQENLTFPRMVDQTIESYEQLLGEQTR